MSCNVVIFISCFRRAGRCALSIESGRTAVLKVGAREAVVLVTLGREISKQRFYPWLAHVPAFLARPAAAVYYLQYAIIAEGCTLFTRAVCQHGCQLLNVHKYLLRMYRRSVHMTWLVRASMAVLARV